ncbi:MAG TPA: lysylphosphatidylglycerol synthase transmembrane domain-containing protein [Acidobacteriota bacterium]
MQPGKISRNWKTIGGIALSLIFIYLAFRRVDLRQMGQALAAADYWYLLPVLAVTALGLVLRSWRWQYLLRPMRRVGVGVLFSSLCIGYMANTFLPAHLGEVVRAWHASKKTGTAASSVFATIVVERLIDVVSLLLLTGLALMLFPFPGWVRQSGTAMLALVGGLIVLLGLMKRHQQGTMALCGRLLRFLPPATAARVRELLDQFLNGVVPLQRPAHYLAVGVLSLAIWVCYALTFQLLFYAFNFVESYRLPWTAALVAMVVTTISVVVPSSPGYVGTFHFLCQLSLGLFKVPRGPALSYAFVLHAISIFPVFFLGLFFLARDRISLRSLRKEDIHAPDR